MKKHTYLLVLNTIYEVEGRNDKSRDILLDIFYKARVAQMKNVNKQKLFPV